MTKEADQLLKLIDGHIEANIEMNLGHHTLGDISYYNGMRSIRWLVYNFFNAPKEDDIEDAGTKDFSL